MENETRRCLQAVISEIELERSTNEWNETWSWSMRNASFGACFAFYLGTGDLLSKEQTQEILGMKNLPVDQMTLTTEEYLHGLISMMNELPRLAMNSVTAGDFASPVQIAAFVKQLHAAFQVLNLKNDALRKRFDGLKYDVKRVEEILYDLRLRNLVPETPPVRSDQDRSALYELMLGKAKYIS
ncbi:Translin-1 [Malassezia yamatoensis]|uniref:Translin-1 n=1 Tax=Malassezia yamatoensis TaxID=253288 RepID=A0AAJ6CHX3_9BASI|nr:Translin-1 [Malassezia yamatoensis]